LVSFWFIQKDIIVLKMKRTKPDTDTNEASETIEIIDLWSRGKHGEAVDAFFSVSPERRNSYMSDILVEILAERPGALFARFLPGVLFGPKEDDAKNLAMDVIFQNTQACEAMDPLHDKRVKHALKETAAEKEGTPLAEYIKFTLASNQVGPAKTLILRDMMIASAQWSYAESSDVEDPVEKAHAIRWAADRGHADALWKLWEMTENDGITSREERLDMLRRLEKLGHPLGITQLGKETIANDPPAGYKLIVLGAMLGEALAFKLISEAYARGIPGLVTQDMRVAQLWNTAASEITGKPSKLLRALRTRS
jgi:hypothetical protein